MRCAQSDPDSQLYADLYKANGGTVDEQKTALEALKAAHDAGFKSHYSTQAQPAPGATPPLSPIKAKTDSDTEHGKRKLAHISRIDKGRGAPTGTPRGSPKGTLPNPPGTNPANNGPRAARRAKLSAEVAARLAAAVADDGHHNAIRETRRALLKAEQTHEPTETPAATTPQHMHSTQSADMPSPASVPPNTKTKLYGAWRGGRGKGSSMPALRNSPLGARDSVG